MNLSEDSILKPLRQMSGQPAPGEELGGWYLYNPDYDFRKDDAGFAPAAPFGQWVSALARAYAIRPAPAIRERVLRLNRLYAQTISGDFYDKNRFPTYCYDKVVCGLIDSHKYVGDADAFKILERTTDVATPHLPGKAIEHDVPWREGKDESWTWDESYTISENLFLAYQRGAGDRYKSLGSAYLDDAYYDPLADNRSAFQRCDAHAVFRGDAAERFTTRDDMSALCGGLGGCGFRRRFRRRFRRDKRFCISLRTKFRHRRLGSGRNSARSRRRRRFSEPFEHAQQFRNSLRRLRSFQAHALLVACLSRFALRRQHGARHVQHHSRRAPPPTRWTHLLLRRL